MRKKLCLSVLALIGSATTIVSAPALARHYDDDGYYASDGRYYQGQHAYYNGHHYYRHHCGGGNGAVGTVGGGVGGAVIGNALGGTTGTILGGVGGALLGRHLDKENTRDRRGC
jgi:hypothetical protein